MKKLMIVLFSLCFCVFTVTTINNLEAEETLAPQNEEVTQLNTISIYNDKQFKRALYGSWQTDNFVCCFFNSHIGDIIEFNGYISDRKNVVIDSEPSDSLFNYKINTHNGYGQGNDTESNVIFLIECFGYYGLRTVCPEATDKIEIGTDLHIVAEIEEYEAGVVSIIPINIVITSKPATEK